MNTAQTSADTGATPQQLGIGMRFSIHPHTDDFVEVILAAIGEAQAAGLTEGLVIDTDDVSTYVGATDGPAEQRLVGYLAAVVTAAARGGHHVVAHVLLSRGCPGEVSCDLSVTGLPEAAPVEVAATGVPAVAQWSLYPLLDGGDSAAHMPVIEEAIARAQERGTATGAAHYATRLTGDLADVLATATDAWAAVGAQIPHVVSHLTVSVNSPTPQR